jgi:hypothetical protein
MTELSTYWRANKKSPLIVAARAFLYAPPDFKAIKADISRANNYERTQDVLQGHGDLLEGGENVPENRIGKEGVTQLKAILNFLREKKKEVAYCRDKQLKTIGYFKYLAEEADIVDLVEKNFQIVPHYTPRFYPEMLPGAFFTNFIKNLERSLLPLGAKRKRNFNLRQFLLFVQTNFTRLSQAYASNEYYLTLKKKLNNYHLTVVDRLGHTQITYSAGRFLKKFSTKRNKKIRGSYYTLPQVIAQMCIMLKKKKIFFIEYFLKPSYLKPRFVNNIIYGFSFNGVPIKNLKITTACTHGEEKKNKKVRRL